MLCYNLIKLLFKGERKMKKIISILVAIVLVLALCAMPTSAASAKSEWKKMTGPGKLELNEQGVKCVFDEGLTFFKYTKQMVDCKNFSCTFIAERTEFSNAYFAVTLTASEGYTGTGCQGLFLLMRANNDNTLNIEGQILHTGYNVSKPKSKDIKVDTTKPITIYGKDNGNGTYTVTAEGGEGDYTFEIPENYMFTEDANGQSYLTIGGTMNEGDAARAMTLVSVNGIDMSGNKPEPESSSQSTTGGSSDNTTDGGDNNIIGGDSNIIGGDNTTTTTDGEVEEEASSNSALIIVIVVCGVLVLGAIAAVVIIIIKKKSATNEETQEETEE